MQEKPAARPLPSRKAAADREETTRGMRAGTGACGRPVGGNLDALAHDDFVATEPAVYVSGIAVPLE